MNNNFIKKIVKDAKGLLLQIWAKVINLAQLFSCAKLLLLFYISTLFALAVGISNGSDGID